MAIAPRRAARKSCVHTGSWYLASSRPAIQRRLAMVDRRHPARILVASAGTGAGKTLVCAALCAVLRDRGLRVRAYKSGPDYIDARLYASVLGAPAHNPDLWL